MGQYVGLDVSLEETSICVLDQAGAVVFEGDVPSNPDAIAKALRRCAPRRAASPSRPACSRTGSGTS